MKKQGLLPLTFDNPSDYDKINPSDKVSLLVEGIAPGKQVKMIVKPKNGKNFEVLLNHTMNEGQIEWFKKGSALNAMKEILSKQTH